MIKQVHLKWKKSSENALAWPVDWEYLEKKSQHPESEVSFIIDKITEKISCHLIAELYLF